jgi:hypothetical protein
MKKTIIMLLAIVFVFGKMNAQKPAVVVSDKKGWHKIGSTNVNFKTEREEVIVMGADRFASIKFKVEDAPISLVSAEIYYESGDSQNIPLAFDIKSPGESRVIDLNGGERSLKKIVFVYKTLPNRKDEKAHIEIWGYKTNADKK